MRIKATLSTLLIALLLTANSLACDHKQCDLPKDWILLETKAQEAQKTQASISLKETDIKLGQPFSFTISFCNTRNKKPTRVTANAIMPAHQHGMNYTPTVTFDAKSGNYQVTDFLFHMPGKWEITISRYNGDYVTHHTKTVILN